MVRMQNTTFMSAKNTRLGLGNILYHKTIYADEEKMGVMLRCFSSFKRKYDVIRLLVFIGAISLIVGGFFAINYVGGVLVFILYIFIVYLTMLAVGLIFIRPKMFIPIRYEIYVHEIPGKPQHKSIILVPYYYPRGREVIIIPLDIVESVGIVKESKYFKCADARIEGFELFILNKRRKEITRFGILCDQESVEEVARDLWSLVKKYGEE